jgi:hypothetical protein
VKRPGIHCATFGLTLKRSPANRKCSHHKLQYFNYNEIYSLAQKKVHTLQTSANELKKILGKREIKIEWNGPEYFNWCLTGSRQSTV